MPGKRSPEKLRDRRTRARRYGFFRSPVTKRDAIPSYSNSKANSNSKEEECCDFLFFRDPWAACSAPPLKEDPEKSKCNESAPGGMCNIGVVAVSPPPLAATAGAVTHTAEICTDSVEIKSTTLVDDASHEKSSLASALSLIQAQNDTIASLSCELHYLRTLLAQSCFPAATSSGAHCSHTCEVDERVLKLEASLQDLSTSMGQAVQESVEKRLDCGIDSIVEGFVAKNFRTHLESFAEAVTQQQLELSESFDSKMAHLIIKHGSDLISRYDRVVGTRLATLASRLDAIESVQSSGSAGFGDDANCLLQCAIPRAEPPTIHEWCEQSDDFESDDGLEPPTTHDSVEQMVLLEPVDSWRLSCGEFLRMAQETRKRLPPVVSILDPPFMLKDGFYDPSSGTESVDSELCSNSSFVLNSSLNVNSFEREQNCADIDWQP